ncbi:MAG: flavin reductase family protein [Oscillospiraceae bacterium]|nr:flavin reductase family protein [Oscillospiraceae bacterium]
MKKFVNAFDYAGHICKALPGGILMTTAAGDTVNTMTIGWGTIGIQWGKPIFIAFVRDSRYTKELLDTNGEFTINVPMGDIDKKILGYCGTKSGRDCDKFADLGLTREAPEVISVPGIRELPLTLECRVIYRQFQEENQLPQELYDRYYPGPVGDYHTAFYGEIVSAYIIE